MGNLGNESTLQAILYHLRRFMPDAEISCITTGPEDTVAIHGIEAVPMAENLFQSWKPQNPLLRVLRKLSIGVLSEFYRWVKSIFVLRHTDALIIPGTGLLTDAYGLLSWGPYNLFRWCVTAKLCRCKLMFVSVGAGPIYGGFARWLVKSALSLADFRSYRDSPSAQYLEDIGFRTNRDRVFPDLVFSHPRAVMADSAPRNHRRPVVALGLMSYAGRYSVPNPKDETYVAYLQNLAQAVRWLILQKFDVNVLIGNLWDLPVRQEFRRVLREKLSEAEERHIIEEPVTCVEQLVSQLAAADLVVATRYHNVLLALLNNKPAISISFHPKCASLMDAMGLSEYCLDIHTLKADSLIEMFRELQENAGKLKLMIRQKTGEFRSMLDEQYALIFHEMWGRTASVGEAQEQRTAVEGRLGVSQG
jgi:polysaccharide pyruvyl transferase WcaK-like protein